MTTLQSPTHYSQRTAPRARWISAPVVNGQAATAASTYAVYLQNDHIHRRQHEMIQLSLLFITVVATCVAIVVG